MNKKTLSTLMLMAVSSPLLAKWEVNDATKKVSDVMDGAFTIGLACLGIPIIYVVWSLLVTKNTENASNAFKGGIVAAVILGAGKAFIATIAT